MGVLSILKVIQAEIVHVAVCIFKNLFHLDWNLKS